MTEIYKHDCKYIKEASTEEYMQDGSMHIKFNIKQN